MKKSCTAIPIHPAKYSYAIDALKSYHNCKNIGDFYFIFSSKEDEKLFKSNCNYEYNSIISNDTNYKNIITYKKLFGLNYLFQKDYDYVAVLDCDIEFIRHLNCNQVYPEIFNQKYLKANYASHAKMITENCARKLGLQNNKILIEKTRNFSTYWWFNEICVFEKETFVEFYKWLFSRPNIINMLNDKLCFDFMLYSIWLICYKDFDIKIMSNQIFSCGAIEHNFDNDNLSKLYDSFADANVNTKNIEKIKIRLHVDREKIRDKFI